MESILQKWLDSHPEIELAILYGSFANGTADARSDVDLAVMAQKPLSHDERIQIIEELEALVQRKVDLVDLSQAHGLILKEVLSSTNTLLNKNPDLYERLLRRNLIERAYFMPLREKILKERRERVFKTNS